MFNSNNTESKSNPSPWMYTKQVSSKSESSSRLSEVSEESGRHLIGGQRQKQNTRNNIRQPRLPIQESIRKTKISVQSEISKFNAKTVRQENPNATIVQSNFLKALKTERMKLQFIRNLFTNSYIIPSDKKKLLHDKYIKEAKKEVMLDKFTTPIIPVISPTSFVIILWDGIGMFLNFIILWLTPFLLSFQNNSSDILQFPELQQIITIFLVSDIIITLNKGVIIQGIVIKKRRKVIQQYIQSNNALNDILNLVLWTLIQQKFIHQHIIGEIITICQLLATYNKIQKYFSDYFQYVFFKGTSSYIMDLFSLMLSIYFFAHIVACFWHYVGQHSIEQSWLKKYDLENSSCWVRYNYAFYWATMTMTTVGYGDITAQSQIEIIFVNIIMFLSSGVFAYSMNSIGLILKNAYDAKQKYKRSLLQMNNYMSKNQVEQQIQSRIRNYIKYYIESEQNENLEDVNRLISVLPSHLQKDLKGDIQIKVINNLKVLKSHFSKQTQLLLSKNLELVKYTPGDVIYKKGDIQDKNLYFIVEGEVSIYDESSKMKFSKIKQMEAFGVYSFFTNFPPKTSAKSVGFSNIYKISRKQFLEVLQFNKKDFEKFHQIKDQIVFNQNLRILDMQCQFCNRYSHQEIDCPLLTYQPDLEQRLKKDAYDQKICARLYKERKQIKFQSKINYLLIVERAKEFRQDHLESDINNSLQLAIIGHRSKSNNYSDGINMDHKKSVDIFNEEEFKDGESMRKTVIKPEQQQYQQDHNVRTSRHTYKEQTCNIKEFSMLDEMTLFSKQTQSLQTDHQQSYENYFPQGNFEIVVEQLEKQNQKQHRKILKYLDRLSKYTFFYKPKLRALKLRQIKAKMHSNN